jgi:hypothetical protein
MVDLVTPVGRIVWGNPLVAKQRRDDNNKPKLKDDGTPDMVYSFGLAIQKTQAAPIFAAMQQEAMGVFPSGQFPADFAWKFVDGDTADRKGQPYARRTGYAGHIVIAIESSFPIKTVQLNGGVYQDMTQGVKTGDYVMVGLGIVGHGQKPGVRMSKPGLYINPKMVRFVGYGEEINNGPDAADMFGTGEVALPPGASAMPTAPAAAMPGFPAPAAPMPGFPAPAPQQVMPGFPAPAPGFPPQPGVAPAHDFVTNAGAAPGTIPGFPTAFPGNGGQ